MMTLSGTKLTDTQLIALSGAAQRQDSAVSLPERIKGMAAEGDGLAGPVHFYAALTSQRQAGSVVHFASVIYTQAYIRTDSELKAKRTPSPSDAVLVKVP